MAPPTKRTNDPADPQSPRPQRPVVFWLRLAVSAGVYAGFWWCVQQALASSAASGSLSGPLAFGAGDFSATDGVEAPAEIKPVILIDAGHGGADPGTSANGEQEKTWTLDVAKEVAAELQKRGHPVEMTRRTDEKIKVEDRCIIANSRPRIAFVSIHFNADGKSAESSGIETLYSWPRKPDVMMKLLADLKVPAGAVMTDDRSRKLAEHIQHGLIAETGARDRGVRNRADTPRDDLAVTSRTFMPAVLVECGFLSNADECARIKDKDYRKKLVTGIVNGITAWLAESSAPGYGIRIEEKPAGPQ